MFCSDQCFMQTHVLLSLNLCLAYILRVDGSFFNSRSRSRLADRNLKNIPFHSNPKQVWLEQRWLDVKHTLQTDLLFFFSFQLLKICKKKKECHKCPKAWIHKGKFKTVHDYILLICFQFLFFYYKIRMNMTCIIISLIFHLFSISDTTFNGKKCQHLSAILL